MNLQQSKNTLKARCATYTDELILSSMDTKQQRAALAGSISTMYDSLLRRGFFSTNPVVTLLPATEEEIAQLDGFKSAWVGATKLRYIQGLVNAEIDALTNTSTFDFVQSFNAHLATL